MSKNNVQSNGKYNRDLRKSIILGIMRRRPGQKKRIRHWRETIWREWPSSQHSLLPTEAQITYFFQHSDQVMSAWNERGHFKYYLYWIKQESREENEAK